MVAKPLYPLYKNIIKPLDRVRYPELRLKVKDLSHVEAMDDAEESYWIPLSNLHPEEFGLGSIRQGVAKFLAKHKTKE